MDIASMFLALRHTPELMELSYITFQCFLRCSSALKGDILQPQPHTVSVTAAPDALPPIITEFLSNSFDIMLEAVDMLWDSGQGHRVENEGLTSLVLYPPNKTCTNPDCNALQHGSVLKKEEQHQGSQFSLMRRAALVCVCVIRIITIIMPVCSGFRHYYPGVPKYLQVGEHQFIQWELGMHWMDLMQIVVSAMNYWQFKTSPTTEEVWDSFVLLVLLDDHQRHGSHCGLRQGLLVHSAPLLRTLFTWDSGGPWDNIVDELARAGELLDEGIKAMIFGHDKR
ncbi:hypothetical protein F4604DRAFT_1929075 [Suillus subluteus]|nr:hypothetical protein F4604DRAFT_1929075 [Suillus subluteus]